jgi:hypothetical protein
VIGRRCHEVRVAPSELWFPVGLFESSKSLKDLPPLVSVSNLRLDLSTQCEISAPWAAEYKCFAPMVRWGYELLTYRWIPSRWPRRYLTLEQLHLGLGILSHNMVRSTSALHAKPFLELGIPADFWMFHHCKRWLEPFIPQKAGWVCPSRNAEQTREAVYCSTEGTWSIRQLARCAIVHNRTA